MTDEEFNRLTQKPLSSLIEFRDRVQLKRDADAHPIRRKLRDLILTNLDDAIEACRRSDLTEVAQPKPNRR